MLWPICFGALNEVVIVFPGIEITAQIKLDTETAKRHPQMFNLQSSIPARSGFKLAVKYENFRDRT